MAHDHSHHDHHHHHQPVTLTNVTTSLVVGIILNFLFVVIEVVVGLFIHSLSLLSDAGHNLADVGALALSLLAFKLLKVKSNDNFTYGYRKTSILIALFNAAILLLSIGAILFEAVRRLFGPPQHLPGITVAIVAGIGILVNAGTAWLMHKDKDKDLNMRGAYLHMLSDAVVSFGLVVGGVIIFYTNFYWIDSVLSIIIAIVILAGTWKLLKDSLKLSMDGVPEDIKLDDIKAAAMKVKGVMDLHHIHIWALSTNENALTAHLVLAEETTIEQEAKIKHDLKHQLEHKNIHHITLETERDNQHCHTEVC